MPRLKWTVYLTKREKKRENSIHQTIEQKYESDAGSLLWSKVQSYGLFFLLSIFTILKKPRLNNYAFGHKIEPFGLSRVKHKLTTQVAFANAYPRKRERSKLSMILRFLRVPDSNEPFITDHDLDRQQCNSSYSDETSNTSTTELVMNCTIACLIWTLII